MVDLISRSVSMHRLISTCFAILAALCIKSGSCAEVSTLSLERVIALGNVKGRIDHLAVDLQHQRLFVAELGNDTVGVIDLVSNQVSRRLGGLREPQGLGYLQSTDTLYVANGGDGSVRLFSGAGLNPEGTVDLGSDADNIRIEQQTGTVYVGYGSVAIGILGGTRHRKDIPVGGHPESFQIGNAGTIYVNVPDARQLVIAGIKEQAPPRKIAIKDARANFPMALDEEAGHVLVAFREPPSLRIMTLQGERVADVETCRDADDVFIDRKRHRVYVICGQGVVDVLDSTGVLVQRIATKDGARTGLFVAELDRLFVAVPARGETKASVLVFQSLP